MCEIGHCLHGTGDVAGGTTEDRRLVDDGWTDFRRHVGDSRIYVRTRLADLCAPDDFELALGELKRPALGRGAMESILYGRRIP